MSEPVERPLLNLAHASTLVDAIEEALKACVHEDGRWKLLLATLTCVPRTHWSEAQVVSNRRATAIWVAMALAEEFRRQYLDDAAGEPESTPAADPSLCNVTSSWGHPCVLPAGHEGPFHEIGGGYGFRHPRAADTQEAHDA